MPIFFSYLYIHYQDLFYQLLNAFGLFLLANQIVSKIFFQTIQMDMYTQLHSYFSFNAVVLKNICRKVYINCRLILSVYHAQHSQGKYLLLLNHHIYPLYKGLF